jgi:hypothetical protein
MKTAVEAVNHALIFLGQAPIQDLSQTTPAAQAASVLYLPALEEVLRAHPWGFATTRKKLAPLADAPDYGYSYQYQRPAGWLRTLECSANDFRHEGKHILCNDSSITLRYIRREEDLTVWDALACQALARNLAAKLAYPLTKSKSEQEAQWGMYASVLEQARGIDGQEEPTEEFEQSTLLSVRG